MNLTGTRCQCGACRAYFNSTAAFDQHRVGEHGTPSRRCLSADEMRKAGMAQSAEGWWVTPDGARIAAWRASK